MPGSRREEAYFCSLLWLFGDNSSARLLAHDVQGFLTGTKWSNFPGLRKITGWLPGNGLVDGYALNEFNGPSSWGSGSAIFF
jgi:hypothetical protein